MRYQTLFLVVFTIVCAIQYSASRTTPSPAMDGGWNSDEVYLNDDDNDGYSLIDSSDRGRPSRKNKGRYDDDDDYYDNDYKDNDDDEDYGKDYKNKGRRPSYKDNDDDEDYDKEYKNKGRRPSKHPKKPKDMGHMSIYLREPSKDGKRKNPKRFRFPVAQYERDSYPRQMGPLLSFMPWLPIFADRFTKQTIIYSPTGGVYILPPVINFYGDLISVAQLIASGYASLVSTGAPPPPAVDVAPLVQPGAVVGPGVPTINPSTGGFKGGVRTDYRSLPRANYPNNYQERSNSQPKTGY